MVANAKSWGVLTTTAPSGLTSFNALTTVRCSSEVPGGVSTSGKRYQKACNDDISSLITRDSHGSGRTFYRLKHLTGHFVRTEPYNIFALFTRN